MYKDDIRVYRLRFTTEFHLLHFITPLLFCEDVGRIIPFFATKTLACTIYTFDYFVPKKKKKKVRKGVYIT